MRFLRSFLCIFVLLFSIYCDNARAAGDDFIAPLCNLVGQIQGTWGKALLVVAAIFVGVNVFIGKFSFPMLIGFIAAGALILSPQAVINLMSGGSNFDCADYQTKQ